MHKATLSAALLAALSGFSAYAEDVSNETLTTRIKIDQKAKAFVFIIDNDPLQTA